MIAIHWFRRDLRLHDNAALHAAMKSGLPVLPVFIFDKAILDRLPAKDARVTFIFNALTEMNASLQQIGSSILVHYGNVQEAFEYISATYQVKTVYTNRDYEPYALERDAAVEALLQKKGIGFSTHKDHVIFEAGEVLKADQTPYTVYTPYSRRWKERFQQEEIKVLPDATDEGTFYPFKGTMPTLKEMGFEPSNIPFPPKTITAGVIKNYSKNRDIPSIAGTSRLSVHFRFGTISIREKALAAANISEKWLNELVWRDFYSSILFHFPHVATNAFKPAYDRIVWRNNEGEFEAWKKGKTGYPLVDAGMRELAATGFMHNRVRMVVASFLTKHLLIDWRWGEAWFAEKLIDFDLASNNGGWQWAAGSGVDAAPYFRVFNPELQRQKFDPQFAYIKQWVPEFGTTAYPKPIVEHSFARQRCLETYKSALG